MEFFDSEARVGRAFSTAAVGHLNIRVLLNEKDERGEIRPCSSNAGVRMLSSIVPRTFFCDAAAYLLSTEISIFLVRSNSKL
jgi:hypothetical protein